MDHDCAQCGALLLEHIYTVTCGNSCQECGRYAYRADRPFYLYLLTNQKLKLHKIGIGTVGKDKNFLQQLIQADWIVHGLWHSAKKAETFQWEKEIFKLLETQINKPGAQSQGFIGRQDRHWIESVSATAISVTALAQLIMSVISAQN